MIHSSTQFVAGFISGDADAIFEPVSQTSSRQRQVSEPMSRHRPIARPVSSALARLSFAAPTALGRQSAKRVLDVVLAVLILVVCAMPMLAIAIAVKLESPGPVLFLQRRVGLHNRPFGLLKFRTMRHHAPSAADCLQASRHDPRITRVGHILRCTSLDELPQMINVLRGEMSIVGPRPHTPGTRAGGRLFEDITHRYVERHRIRPGITGLAQVRGWRGETDTEEKLLRRPECDLEYIATWSLR